MAYEFKKLSDVEVVETPADTANVLIEEDGIIKRTPRMTADDEWDIIATSAEYLYAGKTDGNFTIVKGTVEECINKLIQGEIPKIKIYNNYVYGNEYQSEEIILQSFNYFGDDELRAGALVYQPSSYLLKIHFDLYKSTNTITIYNIKEL